MIVAAAGVGQDKAAYDQRNIARYLELFRVLDRDGDGAVTLVESRGDLNFLPTFNDMDVDRDASVTKSELHRYLTLVHGMQTTDPALHTEAPRPAAPRPAQ
jgi:hypothetical protein